MRPHLCVSLPTLSLCVLAAVRVASAADPPPPIPQLIMPGYCVAGTTGHKVLNGAKKVEFDNPRQVVEVKMAAEYMSFSAHADAKGIMQLIQYCQPKNVMLVHGDPEKMVFLQSKIQEVSQAVPSGGEWGW